MALQKGTKAPGFTLKQKTENGLVDVSLEGQIGGSQVVLLFFPLAFTSGCEKEMCTVSNELSEFEKLNATVYGISVDSPFSQEAFAQASGIRIPLLSDFNREVSASYDVLYGTFLPEKLGYQGVAKRSAFVVNRDGVITYSWSAEDPSEMPPFDEIKAALRD